MALGRPVGALATHLRRNLSAPFIFGGKAASFIQQVGRGPIVCPEYRGCNLRPAHGRRFAHCRGEAHQRRPTVQRAMAARHSNRWGGDDAEMVAPHDL